MDEKELLFTEVLGCGRTELYLNRGRTLGPENGRKIAQALRRRMRAEPLAYILGKTEFMGLEFDVTPQVLVPRQETEILVETVLQQVARSPGHQVTKPQILEIGTGSGCIAVSLAKFSPGCRVVATDISAAALEVAMRNARKNGVSERIDFFQSDLFPPGTVMRERFDVIVTNPPYVRSADIDSLEPEVRAEPHVALDGGIDGLDFFRRILERAGRYMCTAGVVMSEIGYDQKDAVAEVCAQTKKFKMLSVIQDYNGSDRVVIIGR